MLFDNTSVVAIDVHLHACKISESIEFSKYNENFRAFRELSCEGESIVKRREYLLLFINGFGGGWSQ